MMHGMNGYGSIWMMVFWILLIALGVFLLIRFIKDDGKRSNSDKEKNQNDNPLFTLKERLAKGEIEEAEYYHLREIIKSDEDVN